VGWQTVAPMAYPRVLATSVLLPDGTVLVLGGSRSGTANHANDPVMTPELYDPLSGKWNRTCTMRVPRIYHSTALLLPDGRVLTAGRDHEYNDAPYDYPERRLEIFSPPYLFAGDRPAIEAVSNMGYGPGGVSVQISGSVPSSRIARAVLMGLGTVTHGFNSGQRAVELTITARAETGLTLSRPPNANIAPAGDYMLFLLSNANVPSIAKFVRL
jgi:hypothetical protein